MSRTKSQRTSQPPKPVNPVVEQRLQKVLAQAGVASRRHCETLITDGRVKVNGAVCTVLGTKVDPTTARIEVDDKPISAQRAVAIVLHKPTSCVTTVTDPEGRRTVLDFIQDITERLYPVGRLDYDTSGLLLLSNDGELTHRLLHPGHFVDKVYRVTVLDLPEREAVAQLRAGVLLEDGKTQPADVSVLRNHPKDSVLEVTIHEGRNRQVRRMFEAVGMTIKRLKRVQFGVLELGALPPGKWRLLTPTEWQALYASVNLPAPEYPGQPTGRRSMEHTRSAHGNRKNSSGARQTRSGPTHRR